MSQEEQFNNSIGQQYDSQQSQVVPQPLHLQLQSQQHSLNQSNQQQPQSLIDESNSSSLVYDRTIKVPKTGYTDHGSHGVAALPLVPEGQGYENGIGVGANSMGAAAPGGLPSSVQMQLQMQQMAMMLQQQQQNQRQNINLTQPTSIQQQQQQTSEMMPPPPNTNNGALGTGVVYPSLVPGSMGSQILGGGAAAAAPAIMNTTSSGLMQALNAQMAANQAAINNSMAQGNATAALSLGPSAASNQAGMPGVGGGMMNFVDQQGNPIAMGNKSNLTQVGMNAPNLSNLSNLTNLSTLGPQGVTAAAGGDVAALSSSVINNDMIAPGDIRNGKKRVSPSVPLHPSQLQLHHNGGGVGAMFSAAAPGGAVGGLNGPQMPNNLGMNAVAEEEEASLNGSLPQHLLQSQQLLNSIALGVGQLVNQQGLLGTALNQGLPPSSEFALASQQKQQVGIKGKQTAPSNMVDLTQDTQEDGYGDVLTNPSVPSANSGLDNAEGNLIVRKGDVLKIPRKNMHSHPPNASLTSKVEDKKEPESTTSMLKTGDNTPNNNDDHVEYKVVSLLGQGTFAQVFHCIEQKSKKAMAVKIVKNKPAYTRQAAVEIDVFRKLNAVDDKSGGNDSADGGESAATTGDAAKSSPTRGSKSTSTFSSCESSDLVSDTSNNNKGADKACIIRLMHYFMHSSHLCLVFEMLGPNLYELLKKRQFRGLPIGAVRTLIQQATEGIKLLGQRNVVHCDLKPENILMVSSDVDAVIAECKTRGEHQQSNNSMSGSPEKSPATGKDEVDEKQYIKLIDFGSACFEGQTTHTYIQSRFYRSPEVLIGLPYDSAIDIWSLGCVAAELFLGLPILPGVHEHDQLGRILEMIGNIPEWMLDQGSKSGKFFNNVGGNRSSSSRAPLHFGPSGRTNSRDQSSSSTSWEFKTRQEYISYLTEDEKRSKGGLSKLEQQQTNRYFKKKRLEDIVMHHGVCNTKKEREQLGLFVHFLKGVLDPDPFKRWTAHQASMHPFLTGSSVYRVKTTETSSEGAGNKPYDIHWVPPWDASISRRKLMIIQKSKEKAAAVAQAQAQQQQASRRRLSLNDVARGNNTISQSVPETGAMPHNMLPPLSTQGLDIYGSPLKSKHKLEPQSPAVSITSQMAAMADAMSLERARSNISNISGKGSSPPASLMNGGMFPQYPSVLSASLGGVGIPLAYQQLADIDRGVAHPNLAGRSLSENMMGHPDPQLAAAAAAAQHHQQQAQLQASLSGLNDMAFLQPPPPPPSFMGAQSFSGAYYPQGVVPNGNHPYMESDLGYALQRPGVVPGGNDAFIGALRRQSSASNPAALLAAQQQQQAMMSASLNNLSSSTHGVSAGPGPTMSYHAMSPGGLLLQQLGLQEQLMLGNQQHGQFNAAGGGTGGTSLLAQQLEEYSQSDQPQGGQQQQQQQQYPTSQNHLMGNPQQSFPSSGPSVGMLNPGSYHGGPMSMATSLPRNTQSASFSDFNSSSMQQQQNMALHPQLRMNASFPVPQMMVHPNGNDGSQLQQQNNAPNNGQLNGNNLRRVG